MNSLLIAKWIWFASGLIGLLLDLWIARYLWNRWGTLKKIRKQTIEHVRIITSWGAVLIFSFIHFTITWVGVFGVLIPPANPNQRISPLAIAITLAFLEIAIAAVAASAWLVFRYHVIEHFIAEEP